MSQLLNTGNAVGAKLAPEVHLFDQEPGRPLSGSPAAPLVHHTSHSTTDTPKRPVFELKNGKNPAHRQEIFIPNVSVSPKYLAFFDVPANGCRPRTEAQRAAEKFLRENDPDGMISKKANSRINQIVTWFTSLAKKKTKREDNLTLDYQLTFVTLTLPSKQMHDDKFIKRNLLNRFLITAERNFSVKNYFWRAEAQENGNIHFHILIDTYINWRQLRDTWNQICKDFGYIEAYQNKMQSFFSNGFKMMPGDNRTEEQQYEAYQRNKATNFTDPNSTDIHRLKFVRNVAAYVAKYCAKNNRYFAVRSQDLLQTQKQIKALRDTFDVRIKNQEVIFCMKAQEIKEKSIEQILQDGNVLHTEAREKKIRDIEGRLWYASDSVLQLKNMCYEVTAGISQAIHHITTTAKGKWIKVSEYCRLFVTDVFNSTFDSDLVAPLYEKLLPDIRAQFAVINN